mmetsp:Transcript_7128/g.10215  ORF Transcript_7128/g.10215 Transcript_7128/m.10215 type:complete len:151 (-) Transcript_7128:409-861(-)
MTLSQEEYADSNDNELLQQIKSMKWNEVRDTIGSESGCLMTKEPDIYGNLALHVAIGYKAPDDIILSILESNPEATRVHGTDYWLPLHVAAMWGSSSKVMEELIRRHPEGLDDRGEPGIKGRTPRHFSTRFEHNKSLLEKSTESWKLEIS